VRLGDDGTVLVPSVRDCRSVLTLTEPKMPEELRERLRTYLNRPTSAIDPARSDDPVASGPCGWTASEPEPRRVGPLALAHGVTVTDEVPEWAARDGPCVTRY
jgi:hypothetical protein